MRNFDYQQFTDRKAIYHQPIETPEDVYALDLEDSDQVRQLLSILPKVAEEKTLGYHPKTCINFSTGDIYLEYFPMAMLMAKLGLRPGPTGVSCCVITTDNYILGLKRSEKNNSCRGFLGPVAGFITAQTQHCYLEKLISAEIREQMEHEISIDANHLQAYVKAVVSVDYPSKQEEVLVLIMTDLTSQQIFSSARTNTDRGLGKIAEQNVRWLKPEKLLRILKNQELHIATAHALALCLGLSDTDKREAGSGAQLYSDREVAHHFIAALPDHDPKEIWTNLDELLASN